MLYVHEVRFSEASSLFRILRLFVNVRERKVGA